MKKKAFLLFLRFFLSFFSLASKCCKCSTLLQVPSKYSSLLQPLFFLHTGPALAFFTSFVVVVRFFNQSSAYCNAFVEILSVRPVCLVFCFVLFRYSCFTNVFFSWSRMVLLRFLLKLLFLGLYSFFVPSTRELEHPEFIFRFVTPPGIDYGYWTIYGQNKHRFWFPGPCRNVAMGWRAENKGDTNV